jgi:hypothetical protein
MTAIDELNNVFLTSERAEIMNCVIFKHHQCGELREVISDLQVLFKVTVDIAPICDITIFSCNLFKVRLERYAKTALVPKGKNKPWLSWVNFIVLRIDDVFIIVRNVDMHW